MRQILFRLLIVPIVIAFSCASNNQEVLSYTVDPGNSTIEFFWKNDQGEPLKSLGALREYVKSKHRNLIFAMNGGMYNDQNSPVGLYIEHGKTLKQLNTHQVKPDKNGLVPNFHIYPNGVFYITNQHQAVICKTSEFPSAVDVKFATQSGPLLVVDSSINKAFHKGSSNREIRNGVGLLSNNQIIFAISKGRINFHDFAEFFRSKGCRQALFLDGVVSRTYLPDQKWGDEGGNFGVMIGVVK